MKMPETARYTALVAKNAKQAATDMPKVLQVEIEAEEKAKKLTESEFAKRYSLYLVGTTTTWFLLDIAFYSQNLFQKDIFRATGWIPPSKETNTIPEVYKIARAQTLIAICSSVPGHWFTVEFIDYMCRFVIQFVGFFFMTIFMFALAIPYDHWTKKENRIGFVVMYSRNIFLFQFWSKCNHICCASRDLPSKVEVHMSWNISCCWKSWCNCWCIWVPICCTK